MLGGGLNTVNVGSRHPNRTGPNSKYANRASIECDGTDDYMEADLASDFSTQQGTISCWVASDTRGGAQFVLIYKENGTTSPVDQIMLINQGISGTGPSDAVVMNYFCVNDGTTTKMQCAAMASSSFFGHGHSRRHANYHSGGSGFTAEDSLFNNATPMASGSWVHYACTWDTTEVFTPTYANSTSASITPSEITGAMRIYVNGTLKNHGQSSGTAAVSNGATAATGGMTRMLTAPDKIRVGANRNLGNDLDGHINNLAIFNKRLTDDEISAIYNSGSPFDLRYAKGTGYTRSSALVGYWTMQEESGTTVYDRSKNNNHFTLSNNAAFTSDNP